MYKKQTNCYKTISKSPPFQSIPRRKLPMPERKANIMNKTPLEKSLSMPDIQNRVKKRERLMAYV